MKELANDFFHLLMKHYGIDPPSASADDFQVALVRACITTLIEKLTVDGFKDKEEENAFYRVAMPLYMAMAVFVQRKMKEKGTVSIFSIPPSLTDQTSCNWTGSKTELTELIYMISHSGVINNGNAKTTEIAGLFERVFNIALGNISKTFQEIRNRKKDTTCFATKLGSGLVRYIDKLDEDDLNSRVSKRA